MAERGGRKPSGPGHVTDVTEDWDLLLPTLAGAGPAQSAVWGHLVARHFDGEFRAFRVTVGTQVRYVPALLGGRLAPTGFTSGHLGYGGVFDSRDGDGLSVESQLETLRLVSAHLDLPCRRLTTGARPGPAGAAAVPGGTELQTWWVRLTDDSAVRWGSYTGRARRAIRRCEAAGLTVQPIGAAELQEAAGLVQTTQDRVGAGYRTPAALLADLQCRPGFGMLLGAHLDNVLVAAGAFLRFAGRVSYLCGGRRPELTRLAPMYQLLHSAIERYGDLGDRLIDLGYSHRPSLTEFKRAFGGSVATFTRVELLR